MQLQTITFFVMVEYENEVYIIFLEFRKIYSLLQILSCVVNYCTLILKDNLQSTS